jgi:hypothetical protein
MNSKIDSIVPALEAPAVVVLKNDLVKALTNSEQQFKT